jgi:thiol-disulfide isomerase/thioredoxin
MMLLAFACSNSNVSSTDYTDAEEAQADEYAMLRESGNATQKIVEDLSGKVIVLSEKDFIERITDLDNSKGFQYKGKTPCIVELYADWCKPCGYLSQLLNELAPEYQGKVIFYKLNIEKTPNVKKSFKVIEIPKILYFKPHREVSSTLGFLNRNELIKKIDDILLKP